MKNSAQLQLEAVTIKIRRETKNCKEIVLVGLGACREHLQATECGSGALHLQQQSWEGHRAGQ